MARKPKKNIKRLVKEKYEPYARVLIVGEGATEECYFEAIRKARGLSNANIKITPSDNPTPLDILNFTDEKVEAAGDRKYDFVFCVFDRDDHNYFDETSRKMETNGYILARSWPCLEYWILLHFEYKRPLFTGSGKKSQCDECVKMITKIMKDEGIGKYKKANADIFKEIIDDKTLIKAIKNGILSCRQADETSTHATRTNRNNTSTEVHKVVERLMKIKP